MGIPRNDFAFEGRGVFDDADVAAELLREHRADRAAVLPADEQAHLDRQDREDAAFSIALIQGGRW